MRLIDADALKETFGARPLIWFDTPKNVQAVKSWDRAMDLINKSPTVDAVLVDPLCEFLASNYEPFYDLDEIQDLRWPIDHEQQKMAWMKFLKNKFAPEKRDQGA